MLSDSVKAVFERAKAGGLSAGAMVPGYNPTDASLENRNPWDNSLIGSVYRGSESTINAAVSAARDCFSGGEWSALDPAERKAVLLRWCALMEENADELAALDCVDAGKPITECLETDIPETINTFRWYAEACDKLFGKIAPTGPDALALITKEAAGVVGAVLPWNFPAQMFAWKVGPALAVGNSVIVKPAEQTSLSACRMVELAHEAGVPAAALTVVTGLGEETGMPLGLHQDVDVLSFTGSTEVGRLFLQYAARSNLKRVVLECGGKSPQVIFEDVYSLEDIIDDVLSAAFWNMGENCSCGSRLLVHSSRKDELLGLVKAKLADWKVGNPMEPETMIGPMVEKVHFDKVAGHIATATKEGAQLIHGGGTPDMGAGMMVEPTIFDGVTPDMTLFREEVFGPVLAVTTFETEEEAVALANDTHYGLAASFYTADVRRATRVARAIRAGTVSVNCFSEGSIATPFGGYKLSGFGGQDNGLEAFEQYLETKTTWFAN
ncbi:aldehyde dehydrogenase [Parahaliea maris]|uniref:Aldehyde dehydrogenase n=1 Tax=Parahaliea maris TaxID=2716870 RepID=A0A5C9A3B8_9GAMM|nr:aldehyde dehydrogenase [Parahaliea maris]TXS93841.1 aldehyde dehydrogenase [Parahaliea maris]